MRGQMPVLPRLALAVRQRVERSDWSQHMPSRSRLDQSDTARCLSRSGNLLAHIHMRMAVAGTLDAVQATFTGKVTVAIGGTDLRRSHSPGGFVHPDRDLSSVFSFSFACFLGVHGG